MKKSNKIKIMGLSLLAALNIISLSGCSSKLKAAQKELNQAMREKINNSETTDELGISKIDKYSFLSAEYNNENLKSYVDISGIAKFVDGKQGYINTGIYVDKAEFKNVNSQTKIEDVLSILTNNIKNNAFDYLEVLPVENIKKLSSSVSKSIDSPIEDFNYYDGMLYGLSKPTINNEEGYAVFQAKTYMKYSKTVTTPTMGLTGVDANGKPTYGMVLVTNTYYEHYDHKTNVYVKANEDELKAMETDLKLVYSKFVDLYSSKNKDNYVIQSLSVEQPKVNNIILYEQNSLDFSK